METENPENLWICAVTKTSSWPIVRGSLDDTVTCESSISDSDPDHADVPRRKPPLILRRPSPDCAPCEITIHFAQRHEIKQVYVRSTARVYEIYYAADEKGDNDYLCTVRCSMVEHNEELVQETDGKGSSSVSHSDLERCVEEGHSRTESGSSTNEDGWVDVKVPDPHGLVAVDAPLSNKNGSCMERGHQDLFEATAEISDADPVLSVTLRLLSIQSGDHFYADEIYVFADPVVSTDTNSSATSVENSSGTGSALMSMLVPTLLQLSKSRLSEKQQQNVSAAAERTKHQDIEYQSTGGAITSNTFQSTRLPNTVLSDASVHMSQPEVPLLTPDSSDRFYSTSRDNNFPSSRIERTLNELVSRVVKIEHFCLGFEESMLKPINSMEARLERVEQQMELFIKDPQFSRTTCTIISAPEFSCNESESNSICTDGNDYPENRKSETLEKELKDDYCLEELSVPPLDASSSVNVLQVSDTPSTASASQLLPSLVITAPDFSYVDDEEENDAIEPVKDLAEDAPKKPLSIDDVLASSLAGFLSSATSNPLKCTDMVEEAADFRNVEWSGDNLPETLDHVDGSNETATISCKDFAVAKHESLTADNDPEDKTEAVDVQNHTFEEGDKQKPVVTSVNNVVSLDEGTTEDNDLTIEISSTEADDDPSQAFVSNCLVPLALVDSDCSEDVSVVSLEVPDVGSSFSGKVAEEDPDVLQNILKSPRHAMVDFEIPILNVKFSSAETLCRKSPIEALLIDTLVSQTEVQRVNDDGSSFSEQNDLVTVENEESATSETYINQLFCLDDCNSGSILLNAEEELYKCNNQDIDMCGSLI